MLIRQTQPFSRLLLISGILVYSAVVTSKRDYSSDFQTFASRPDISAPQFTIPKRDRESIYPGYWFVAIYPEGRGPHGENLNWTDQLQRPYLGPHIFDNNGALVWSGASLFHGRGSFDFKPSQYYGSQHLSFILDRTHTKGASFKDGGNIILNSSYQFTTGVPMDIGGTDLFDMHEFKLIDDGKRALRITTHVKYWEDASMSNGKGGLLRYEQFQEIESNTGRVLFTWDSMNNVHPSESYVPQPHKWHESLEDNATTWTYFHMNSVDKNSDGDYLVSSRSCYAIYKVSGLDGSVVWTLGGKNSSFTFTPPFNFSGQHDARFREDVDDRLYSQPETRHISFLDNAADGDISTAKISSGLLVSLDTENMTASIVSQWDRPDGGISPIRGNMQLLPPKVYFPVEARDISDDVAGNILMYWGENGYMSEFTPSGDLVLDVRFKTAGIAAYRMYKYPWIGRPNVEEIAITALSFEDSSSARQTLQTLLAVSWNGATEVKGWRIYYSQINLGNGGNWILLDTVPKRGFETIYAAGAQLAHVRAEAIDENGQSMGWSSAFTTRPICIRVRDPANRCDELVDFSRRYGIEMQTFLTFDTPAPLVDYFLAILPIAFIVLIIGLLLRSQAILSMVLLWGRRLKMDSPYHYVKVAAEI